MNSSNYPVVDIDAHYMDHIDDIYEYIDEDDPWKEKFELGTKIETMSGITSFFPTSSFNRSNHVYERPDFRSKEDILNAMDELGIDEILLIGQQMLRIGGMRADDLRPMKYTEAYMDYILEEIADVDKGIYVTVPVVHSDPEWAVDIIDRVADEKAVVGAVVVASGGEPPFGNRKYDPIYEACEKFELPVIFHADGSSIDHSHLQGFGSVLETHSLGFLITNMSQITSIVIQGIPERFPNLDIVFQEAGLFYVPTMMYRLDQEYLRSPDDAPLLTKLPSEYMKEFYYGTQPLEQPPKEAHLESIIDMIGGPERLMWASDWPHPDYDETNAITDLSFLSAEEKSKILGGNAAEVFGI